MNSPSNISDTRHFVRWLIVLASMQFAVIGLLSWRIIRIHGPIGRKREAAVAPFTQDTLSRPNTDLSGFYEPKPGTQNVMTFEGRGEKIIHSINADGLRDTENYTVEKPPDVFRVAIMGDSFTYGLFVGDGETYADRLERILNDGIRCASPKRVEVLNFGVPGYDAEMSAFRYGYHARKYSPDLVVWYLIDNDFNESASFVQSLWLDIKMMLAEGGIPYDKFAPKTSEILSSDTSLAFGDKAIPERQKETISTWAGTVSVPAVIVSDADLNPSYRRIISDAISGHPNIMHMDRLAYSGILSDGHPGPDSHRQISEALFGYLTGNELVPCAATQ